MIFNFQMVRDRAFLMIHDSFISKKKDFFIMTQLDLTNQMAVKLKKNERNNKNHLLTSKRSDIELFKIVNDLFISKKEDFKFMCYNST